MLKRISVPKTQKEELGHEAVLDHLTKNTLVAMESEASATPKRNAASCESKKEFKPYPHNNCGSKTMYNCTACPNYATRKPTADSITRYMASKWRPTKHHYWFGKYGIANITGDGSVPNGVEIKTTGVPCWPELLHHMYVDVCETCKMSQLTTNQFTGLHYHVLTPKLETSYRAALGQFYLNNLMVLSGMALPILSFYSRGLDNGRTRYAAFRLPLLHHTLTNNYNMMYMIRNQPHGGKYLAITPYLSDSSGEGERITRPHVEFRYADNILNPDYYILHAVLCAAIFRAAAFVMPGEALSPNDKTYIDALSITPKLVNMGCGDRTSVNMFTDKDVATLSRIKEALTIELQEHIMAIDPKGNTLANLLSMPVDNSPIEKYPEYIGPNFWPKLNGVSDEYTDAGRPQY